MTRPLAVTAEHVRYHPRPLSGSSKVEMGWAVEQGPLLAGFARWDGDDGPFKTLDYDEVLMVVEGHFGFELPSGERFEGGPLTTLRIPKHTPVKYFGTQAKVFFVITPPGE